MQKLILTLIALGLLLGACRKTETIPADAPVQTPPPQSKLGLYSGFFVIECHNEFDTLSKPTSPVYYTPWVRLFDIPQNDYSITKGKNMGALVAITTQTQTTFLNYVGNLNAYLGNNLNAFDSVVTYNFSSSNLALTSFSCTHVDSFYSIPPLYVAIIPPQITYTQSLSLPMPTTTGFDEIIVFVKRPDGTPLSVIKRFPAGSSQLVLNPNDFTTVPLGVQNIEVIIKRYKTQQINRKTYRFEYHNVITIAKRFI